MKTVRTVFRYSMEDVLEHLASVTKRHANVRPVVTWTCDCGCDLSMLFQRTDAGLAFSNQAVTAGTLLSVTILEARGEVEMFARSVARNIRLNDRTALSEGRVASFEKAIWSAWEGEEAS